MKRLAIFVLVSSLVCIGLFAAGSAEKNKGSAAGSSEKAGSAKQPVTLKLANYFADIHPQNIALKSKFIPMVESGTKGGVKVELYPNNQLGAEKEFIEGTKLGSIEMCISGIMLSEKYPVLKVAEFPYLFDSIDNGYKLLNEYMDEITADLLKGEGLRSLGISVNGVRAISNSKRPINTVEDCKGIKLRVPQVNQYVLMGKALGFNVVTMAYSEIFTALQQKVIDGQENPPTTVLASGWYEAQKYIALTDHCIAFNYVLINDKFFQGLPVEYRDVIKAAVKAYTDEEVALYKAAAQKDIDTLKSKGIEFTKPDRKGFKDAVMTVYSDMLGPDPKVNAMAKKFIDLQK
jgi:tripartite ATP-independent transporter DctP family solute receptor